MNNLYRRREKVCMIPATLKYGQNKYRTENIQQWSRRHWYSQIRWWKHWPRWVMDEQETKERRWTTTNPTTKTPGTTTMNPTTNGNNSKKRLLKIASSALEHIVSVFSMHLINQTVLGVRSLIYVASLNFQVRFIFFILSCVPSKLSFSTLMLYIF